MISAMTAMITISAMPTLIGPSDQAPSGRSTDAPARYHVSIGIGKTA
jgi:hypothetical protein